MRPTLALALAALLASTPLARAHDFYHEEFWHEDCDDHHWHGPYVSPSKLDMAWELFETGRHLVRHVGRVAEVYPAGPMRLMQVVAIMAIAMLAVAAVGYGSNPRETLASRYLLALVGFAVVAAFAGMVPFCNTTNDPFSMAGSSGGRHSLWLSPALAVG